MIHIIDLKTNKTHVVRKYVNDTVSNCESVWCDTWYGRHVIGQDCNFIQPELICECGKLKAFKTEKHEKTTAHTIKR